MVSHSGAAGRARFRCAPGSGFVRRVFLAVMHECILMAHANRPPIALFLWNAREFRCFPIVTFASHSREKSIQPGLLSRAVIFPFSIPLTLGLIRGRPKRTRRASRTKPRAENGPAGRERNRGAPNEPAGRQKPFGPLGFSRSHAPPGKAVFDALRRLREASYSRGGNSPTAVPGRLQGFAVSSGGRHGHPRQGSVPPH